MTNALADARQRKFIDEQIAFVRSVMHQNDAWKHITPSDLRVLVGEIDRLRAPPPEDVKGLCDRIHKVRDEIIAELDIEEWEKLFNEAATALVSLARERDALKQDVAELDALDAEAKIGAAEVQRQLNEANQRAALARAAAIEEAAKVADALDLSDMDHGNAEVGFLYGFGEGSEKAASTIAAAIRALPTTIDRAGLRATMAGPIRQYLAQHCACFCERVCESGTACGCARGIARAAIRELLGAE